MPIPLLSSVAGEQDGNEDNGLSSKAVSIYEHIRRFWQGRLFFRLLQSILFPISRCWADLPCGRQNHHPVVILDASA